MQTSVIQVLSVVLLATVCSTLSGEEGNIIKNEKQSSVDSTSIVTMDEESIDDLDKRAHVFRYGKRTPSVFRYGKRAPSVFRYGKRASVFRYGKRSPNYDLDDGAVEVFPKRIFRYGKRNGDELSAVEEELIDEINSGADKRKIFRYGKRSVGDEEREDIKQKQRVIIENSAEEDDEVEKDVELVNKRPAIFRYGR